MSRSDIIRAWKDEEYRRSLSAEQLAALPANPAGTIELEQVQLDAVSGGTHFTCTGNTWTSTTAQTQRL